MNPNTRIAAIAALGVLLAPIAAAETAGDTYAQALIAGALSRHPDVVGLTMHVTPKSGKDNVIVASNVAPLGKVADTDDLKVIKSGEAIVEPSITPGRVSVELPLLDASRRTVGALGVQFASSPILDREALTERAGRVRDELARRISHVANLTEPARYDARVPLNNYGQQLVDRALDGHPEIQILALHANVPKTTDNVIVASNIGRIGKAGDEDDLRLIRTEKPNLEVNTEGNRFEVELVLRDVSGSNIGAIGIVYGYKPGDDKLTLQAKAEAVLHWFGKRITSAGNLFEPVPFVQSPPAAPYAQQLVDSTLARNPDVLILALHVMPPSRTDPVIIASNIGRIGKKADEDDLGVIRTAKPLLEVNEAGNRFEVEVALQDSAGQTIGAVSSVFAYKPGTDRAALQARGERIRDDLRSAIPAASKLFEPARPAG